MKSQYLPSNYLQNPPATSTSVPLQQVVPPGQASLPRNSVPQQGSFIAQQNASPPLPQPFPTVPQPIYSQGLPDTQNANINDPSNPFSVQELHNQPSNSSLNQFSNQQFTSPLQSQHSLMTSSQPPTTTYGFQTPSHSTANLQIYSQTSQPILQSNSYSTQTQLPFATNPQNTAGTNNFQPFSQQVPTQSQPEFSSQTSQFSQPALQSFAQSSSQPTFIPLTQAFNTGVQQQFSQPIQTPNVYNSVQQPQVNLHTSSSALASYSPNQAQVGFQQPTIMQQPQGLQQQTSVMQQPFVQQPTGSMIQVAPTGSMIQAQQNPFNQMNTAQPSFNPQPIQQQVPFNQQPVAVQLFNTSGSQPALQTYSSSTSFQLFNQPGPVLNQTPGPFFEPTTTPSFVPQAAFQSQQHTFNPVQQQQIGNNAPLPANNFGSQAPFAPQYHNQAGMWSQQGAAINNSNNNNNNVIAQNNWPVQSNQQWNQQSQLPQKTPAFSKATQELFVSLNLVRAEDQNATATTIAPLDESDALDVFLMLDENGNGTLEENEFIRLFRTMNTTSATSDKMAWAYNAFNFGGEGHVTFEDFVVIVGRYHLDVKGMKRKLKEASGTANSGKKSQGVTVARSPGIVAEKAGERKKRKSLFLTCGRVFDGYITDDGGAPVYSVHHHSIKSKIKIYNANKTAPIAKLKLRYTKVIETWDIWLHTSLLNDLSGLKVENKWARAMVVTSSMNMHLERMKVVLELNEKYTYKVWRLSGHRTGHTILVGRRDGDTIFEIVNLRNNLYELRLVDETVMDSLAVSFTVALYKMLQPSHFFFT